MKRLVSVGKVFRKLCMDVIFLPFSCDNRGYFSSYDFEGCDGCPADDCIIIYNDLVLFSYHHS